MPKFVVRKVQDAWVHYETVVEAEMPEDARWIARDVMFEGLWFATGDITEFDHLEIDEETGSAASGSRRESERKAGTGSSRYGSRERPAARPVPALLEAFP